ncbi:MAG TPA: SDR family NAD(P)-dependent oxidoreductase, partial [Mycobacterium sp.]|nr:SDR family NAD(P)-dependent oxidoreductase [Mycobacterium sp.]
PTVDPILPDLRTALAGLAPMAPKIPLISTVGLAGGDGTPGFDADYWVANLRNPVRFSQAVTTAAKDHARFVEVSPHALLTHAINDVLASVSPSDQTTVTSAMKRDDDETLCLHTQLARLGVFETSDRAGRFADIPATPWLHASYWLPKRASGHRSPDVHPLLGAHVELLSGRDHIWQADVGTEAGRTVQGRAVMSAAAFVEMTLAAGCQALGESADSIEVTDLGIEQTLVLDGHTQLTTQLSRADNGIRVEIHARSDGGAWHRYAAAELRTVSGPAAASVEAIPAAAEIDVAVPAETADHPCYQIHPALLDAAVQCLVAAVPDASPQDYLPASIGRIRVLGATGRQARCSTELAADGDEWVGRLILADAAGAPIAELSDVRLRRLSQASLPLSLSEKIFDTEWVASPDLGGSAQGGPAAGSWLLLVDDDAETNELAADLKSCLDSPARRVSSARLFDEPAVHEALSGIGADTEFQPAGIVVLIGRRPFDDADPDGELAYARELTWAAWATARAAADRCRADLPRLWLVTRDGLAVQDGESGNPAVGALKGLIRNWRFPGEAARVLAEEPDLNATLVDVGGAGDAAAALLAELESPPRDDVVVWREQHRYVERLTRAGLGAEDQAAIRADGAYIITGGLGGLGTVVARWLVAGGAGRIVLNGRREPAETQRATLDELAAGAEVAFVPGDIAEPGVADRLVAAAEETGKTLRGIVHAAGVTGDGLVVALTREDLERVWAAKAAGALRLHAASHTRQLDWWVGFSSMATLLGLPGQAAYTTANAWLDGLIAWRHGSGLPATAINWGQWSDVGMSHKLTYSVLDPITPGEGTEALQALVAGDHIRVGVGRLRLDRVAATIAEFHNVGYFDQVAPEFTAFGVAADAARTALPGTAERTESSAPDWSQLSAEDTLSELTLRLRTLLARELRMSPSAVDVDQPFPELGLDSMMAMTMLKETQRLVGMDLSASMFWNHPTISALSAYLVELLAPRHAEQDNSAPTTADIMGESAGVLDELFESVESTSAGSESGI